MQEKLEKYLGFSAKESQVYLYLVENGSQKAANIRKNTGLNRTTIYDICDNLIEKGLVSKYKKKEGTFFDAVDPKRLLDYLDREKEEQTKIIDKQKNQVTSLIPELLSLQNIFPNRPKVKFFEGEKGIREAYEDTLTSRETILAYANVETMHAGLPNFFPDYYQRRAKKKIPIKAILPKNKLSIEQSKKDQQELRDTKFLPEEQMTFSPEVNIYNNKMLIASWKEKIAVIIESKEFADLQKLIYNLVWNSLSKNK